MRRQVLPQAPSPTITSFFRMAAIARYAAARLTVILLQLRPSSAKVWLMAEEDVDGEPWVGKGLAMRAYRGDEKFETMTGRLEERDKSRCERQ